jgi:hypothetical protein
MDGVWQAKKYVALGGSACPTMRTKVGQTLSSVNPVIGERTSNRL